MSLTKVTDWLSQTSVPGTSLVCQDLQGHPGHTQTGEETHKVQAADDQNLYLPWVHFLTQPNVTLIGLGLGYGSQTGVGDAGRRIPSAASGGGTMHQEGVRRAIGLPGEAGQIVEGEMEVFFSLDLSSVLDSNCFDPQVLIQGRLSCKIVRAIGTIIITRLLRAYYLMDHYIKPSSAPVTDEKPRPGGSAASEKGNRIPTGIGIQNQSEATIPETSLASATSC